MAVEQKTKSEPRKQSVDLDIRPAQQGNIDQVWEIIQSCSEWLASMGMDHWKKYYSRDLIAKKLQNQQVFLAFHNNELVATITLDSHPVDYYTEQDINFFEDKTAPSMYVTALAVPPKHQNQGIASKLMNFAEEETSKQGAKYVRFDCRVSYQNLVMFYQKRGYLVVGTIIDEADNNEPYYLMEKKIEIL